jgi:hypothetical protein
VGPATFRVAIGARSLRKEAPIYLSGMNVREFIRPASLDNPRESRDQRKCPHKCPPISVCKSGTFAQAARNSEWTAICKGQVFATQLCTAHGEI